MSKKVTVQVQPEWQEHSIILSQSYVKRAHIPDRISLHFGTLKHTVNVETQTRLEGIKLSASVANACGLSSGLNVRIQYRPVSKTLKIGPVIGVLFARRGKKSLFGNTTAFCQELSEACRIHGGFVFFFTPDDIQSQQQRIKGWMYQNGWHQVMVPYPDVVYNRITTRAVENKISVQNFMREVKLKKGKVFNERFLDKNEVFQLLSKNARLKQFLPESKPCKSFATLRNMCLKHPIVFLKPVRGSLGKGILRIVRKPNGKYSCQHTTVNGAVVREFSSLKGLYRSISSKLKTSRYQAQQGLHLLSVSKRPMDFRALVQKNEAGEWTITSIVARIAGNQHFVSNLARGGTLSPVKEALSKSSLSKGKVSVTNQRLRNAAIAIANGLEKQLHEHFGELGIDLAVSKSGKVWLLEVNSKPSKNDGSPLSDNKIRPSVKQIIKYCAYLARLRG